MLEPPSRLPTRAGFDPRLANALAHFDNDDFGAAAQPLEPIAPGPEQPAAFDRYTRSLTAEGGFRITWCDQRAGALLGIARLLTWTIATGLVARALIIRSNLPISCALPGTLIAAVLIGLIVRWKFIVAHSVEIRPNGMIVDGRFFDINGFSENWPQLQMKDDNEDRIVLIGVYGTRLVEFATVNRIDRNSRIPERLAEDLELAMDQLWGRRDAIVATDSERY
jgi:hypothetical protein